MSDKNLEVWDFLDKNFIVSEKNGNKIEIIGELFDIIIDSPSLGGDTHLLKNDKKGQKCAIIFERQRKIKIRENGECMILRKHKKPVRSSGSFTNFL
ncbi:MAG: hypothetical protein ACOCP8_03350 [archaeon]